MLRQRASKDQKDWDKDLHLMTMAYRSTVHETTGMTPNLMMLGRELPMPSYLATDPPEGVALDCPTYVKNLVKSIQGAFQDVREQTRSEQIHQKNSYDRRAEEHGLQVGDLVWLYNHTKKKGLSPKLMTFWEEEPYVLKELLSPVVAVIQREGRRKNRVVHTDKLMKVRDTQRWERPPEKMRRRRKKPPRTTSNRFEAMGLAHMEPNFQSRSVLRRVRQEVIPVKQTRPPEEPSIFEVMGFPQFDPDVERRTRGQKFRRKPDDPEESIFSLIGLPHLNPDYYRSQRVAEERSRA